jgi:Flp pilus assembly pilin Flp
MLLQLFQMLTSYVRDEEGIETLEWIAMGAVIVALALLVYPGTLATTINGVIANIGTKLST